MKTQKIILNGEEKEIVIELDEEVKQDEILNDNVDDTIDLTNIKDELEDTMRIDMYE